MSPENASRSPLPDIFQKYVESGEPFTFPEIAAESGLKIRTIENYFQHHLKLQGTWSPTTPKQDGNNTMRCVLNNDTLITGLKKSSPPQTSPFTPTPIENQEGILDPTLKQSINPTHREKIKSQDIKKNTHLDSGYWRFNVNHHLSDELDIWVLNILRKDLFSKKPIEKYDLRASSNQELAGAFIPWIVSIALKSVEHEEFTSQIIKKSSTLFPHSIKDLFKKQQQLEQ